MCGITGAVWFDPDLAIDTTTLNRMTEVLRHRGPDADGQYASDYRLHPPYGPQPGVALGFRRLSIIDLQYANQPIPNEDETIWVVFNGEIYNFPDCGIVWKAPDTSFARMVTVRRSFICTKTSVSTVSHISNGMFAIAIWDCKAIGNWCSDAIAWDRSRWSTATKGDRLLFASELKSLLQVPGLPT